jgi:hypothetical protein
VHRATSVVPCFKSFGALTNTYRSFDETVFLHRSWLMHCTAIQEVACSFPDGIIGIFRVTYFSCTLLLAVGFTQSLIEMSTKDSTGWKDGCYALLTFADCLKILGASKSWRTRVLYRHSCTFFIVCTSPVLKCGVGEGWRRSVGPIM